MSSRYAPPSAVSSGHTFGTTSAATTTIPRTVTVTGLLRDQACGNHIQQLMHSEASQPYPHFMMDGTATESMMRSLAVSAQRLLLHDERGRELNREKLKHQQQYQWQYEAIRLGKPVGDIIHSADAFPMLSSLKAAIHNGGREERDRNRQHLDRKSAIDAVDDATISGTSPTPAHHNAEEIDEYHRRGDVMVDEQTRDNWRHFANEAIGTAPNEDKEEDSGRHYTRTLSSSSLHAAVAVPRVSIVEAIEKRGKEEARLLSEYEDVRRQWIQQMDTLIQSKTAWRMCPRFTSDEVNALIIITPASKVTNIVDDIRTEAHIFIRGATNIPGSTAAAGGSNAVAGKCPAPNWDNSIMAAFTLCDTSLLNEFPWLTACHYRTTTSTTTTPSTATTVLDGKGSGNGGNITTSQGEARGGCDNGRRLPQLGRGTTVLRAKLHHVITPKTTSEHDAGRGDVGAHDATGGNHGKSMDDRYGISAGSDDPGVPRRNYRPSVMYTPRLRFHGNGSSGAGRGNADSTNKDDVNDDDWERFATGAVGTQLEYRDFNMMDNPFQRACTLRPVSNQSVYDEAATKAIISPGVAAKRHRQQAQSETRFDVMITDVLQFSGYSFLAPPLSSSSASDPGVRYYLPTLDERMTLLQRIVKPFSKTTLENTVPRLRILPWAPLTEAHIHSFLSGLVSVVPPKMTSSPTSIAIAPLTSTLPLSPAVTAPQSSQSTSKTGTSMLSTTPSNMTVEGILHGMNTTLLSSHSTSTSVTDHIYNASTPEAKSSVAGLEAAVRGVVHHHPANHSSNRSKSSSGRYTTLGPTAMLEQMVREHCAHHATSTERESYLVMPGQPTQFTPCDGFLITLGTSRLTEPDPYYHFSCNVKYISRLRAVIRMDDMKAATTTTASLMPGKSAQTTTKSASNSVTASTTTGSTTPMPSRRKGGGAWIISRVDVEVYARANADRLDNQYRPVPGHRRGSGAGGSGSGIHGSTAAIVDEHGNKMIKCQTVTIDFNEVGDWGFDAKELEHQYESNMASRLISSTSATPSRYRDHRSSSNTTMDSNGDHTGMVLQSNVIFDVLSKRPVMAHALTTAMRHHHHRDDDAWSMIAQLDTVEHYTTILASVNKTLAVSRSDESFTTLWDNSRRDTLVRTLEEIVYRRKIPALPLDAQLGILESYRFTRTMVERLAKPGGHGGGSGEIGTGGETSLHVKWVPPYVWQTAARIRITRNSIAMTKIMNRPSTQGKRKSLPLSLPAATPGTHTGTTSNDELESIITMTAGSVAGREALDDHADEYELIKRDWISLKYRLGAMTSKVVPLMQTLTMHKIRLDESVTESNKMRVFAATAEGDRDKALLELSDERKKMEMERNELKKEKERFVADITKQQGEVRVAKDKRNEETVKVTRMLSSMMGMFTTCMTKADDERRDLSKSHWYHAYTSSILGSNVDEVSSHKTSSVRTSTAVAAPIIPPLQPQPTSLASPQPPPRFAANGSGNGNGSGGVGATHAGTDRRSGDDRAYGGNYKSVAPPSSYHHWNEFTTPSSSTSGYPSYREDPPASMMNRRHHHPVASYYSDTRR